MNYYLINAVLLGKISQHTSPRQAASGSRPGVGHLLLGFAQDLGICFTHLQY